MSNTESTAGWEGVKTGWKTIMEIKGDDDATRRAALDRLVTRYYQPILHYFQACWCAEWPEPAHDLTQEFISKRLLAGYFFRDVQPDHGRFRSFVKTCGKNFILEKLKEWGALKRNRGQVPVPLDATDSEGNRLVDPAAATLSPDRAMDVEWAKSILNNALEALERECVDARRGELFRALKGHLGSTPEAGRAAEIGARLGMTEGAVNTAMSRLRDRLGELISEEVQQTVGTMEDGREELKYLVEL